MIENLTVPGEPGPAKYSSTCRTNSSRLNEAIGAFDEAIKLDPTYSMSWYNKGVALKALGRNTDADAAFAKAKELEYSG